jgi:hypothetical protein
MSKYSGYAVICGHTAYHVPLDALCCDGGAPPASGFNYSTLSVDGAETDSSDHGRMGDMLLGRNWPEPWGYSPTQPHLDFRGSFHPSHVRILKGKLKKDGPEVRVWYFAMRPAHRSDARDDMYLLWPMPRHIVADCLESWRYLLEEARVVQLLQTHNLPRGTCKAFNPVLNGWKVSKTHSTQVPTLWRRLRLYARLKGRWRAALRAWHDEVHHRPQHICRKDDHGETEAARAMEAEMAAPVFTAGRLQ